MNGPDYGLITGSMRKPTDTPTIGELMTQRRNNDFQATEQNMQLQQQQMKIQRQQAILQEMKGAIDPSTGKFDMEKAIPIISKYDPEQGAKMAEAYKNEQAGNEQHSLNIMHTYDAIKAQNDASTQALNSVKNIISSYKDSWINPDKDGNVPYVQNPTQANAAHQTVVQALNTIASRNPDVKDILGDIPAQPSADWYNQNESALGQGIDSIKQHQQDVQNGYEKQKLAIEEQRNKILANKPGNQQIASNPNDVNNILQSIATGNTSPDLKEISSRAGGSQAKLRIQQAWQQAHPDMPLTQMEGDNKYWNSPKVKTQRQTMDVVTQQLPNLQQAADEMDRLGIPIFDEKAIKAMAATGNVQAANLLATSAVSIEDIGKAVAGGGAMNEDQQRLASSMIPIGSTPDQIRAQIKAVNQGVNSRKATIYKQGGIYGKLAAQNDPMLDPAIKDEILRTKSNTGNDFDTLWKKHGGK
jgi:hypothetical protein